MVRKSKRVLDSGFHAIDSGFQVLDSGYQLSVDSRFLELYSRFQSPRFLILQAKISRIPDFASKKSWIPECGLPYLGRISYCFSNAPENMHSGSQEHLKVKAYAIFLFLDWIVADSNWIENGSGSCEVKRAIKTTFVDLWHATNTGLSRCLQAINAVFLMLLPLTFNVRQRYFLISICGPVKGVIKYVWDSSPKFWKRCGKMMSEIQVKGFLEVSSNVSEAQIKDGAKVPSNMSEQISEIQVIRLTKV